MTLLIVNFEINKIKKEGIQNKTNLGAFMRDKSFSLYMSQKMALDEISKDTGDYNFGTSRFGGFEKPVKNILKTIGINLDEADQVLDFDVDVQREILKNMSDKDLIKAAKY